MNLLRTKRSTRNGYTIVEMLVVVLVMSVLMAIALPLYLAALTGSETQTCRTNMQSISDAEGAYRNANTSHAYTTNLANLLPNLGARPVCPTGGAYSVVIDGSKKSSKGQSVPAGSIVVICSHHANYAPGYDSQ